MSGPVTIGKKRRRIRKPAAIINAESCLIVSFGRLRLVVVPVYHIRCASRIGQEHYVLSSGTDEKHIQVGRKGMPGQLLLTANRPSIAG